MSALDELIKHHDSVHHAFVIEHSPLSVEAAAELAQLRATVAEQARQLKATKDTINWLKGQYDYDESVLVGYVIHRLSANAPAPQAEATANHDLLIHDPR